MARTRAIACFTAIQSSKLGLAIFNRKPLGDEVLVDSVYRIFLARAAAEFERLQALARLAPATATPGT